MAFDKPVPRWYAQGTEPSESIKTDGFQPGYKPPASFFNWFWYGVSQCLEELQNDSVTHETVAGVSLNAVIDIGLYAYNTRCTEKPSENSGFMIVYRFESSYISQLAMAHTLNKIYTRYSADAGASWTGWAELARAGDCAPAGFGLGEMCADISDKNLLTEVPRKSGFYRGRNVTHAPDVYWWYYVITAGSDTTNAIAFGKDGVVRTAQWNDTSESITWKELGAGSHTHSPNDINGIVPIAKGGTGANTASAAANSLGVFSLLTGTSIGANEDLNNYKTPGNYCCGQSATAGGLTNCPTYNAFTMRVFYANGSQYYIGQELKDYSTGVDYFRLFNVSSDNWEEWKYNFTSSKKPTASDIGAGTFPDTTVKAKTGTDYTTCRIRNILATTNDLAPGVSELASGNICLVYE